MSSLFDREALGLGMIGLGLCDHGRQINDTSLRWASVSPSMYRWVVWIDRWPASSCTSRREPPALWTSLAARVMNVRWPEWDEQPSRPIVRYVLANQMTMPNGVMAPPRSDRTTGPMPQAKPRQASSASRRSLCNGNQPAAQSLCGMVAQLDRGIDVAVGIDDHVPRQARDLGSAQARLG
jgi:hypothetical protein